MDEGLQILEKALENDLRVLELAKSSGDAEWIATAEEAVRMIKEKTEYYKKFHEL